MKDLKSLWARGRHTADNSTGHIDKEFCLAPESRGWKLEFGISLEFGFCYLVFRPGPNT